MLTHTQVAGVPAAMGKSVRSKIKKHHRAIKRRELKPVVTIEKALMSVRVGALDPAMAPEDPELSKPVRFTFNPHAFPNKPRPKVVPATDRDKAQGEARRCPSPVRIPVWPVVANDLLCNPTVPLKSLEENNVATGGEDGMETEKSTKSRNSWRKILRQRIKKKMSRRSKRGWDNIPAVSEGGGSW